MKVAFLDRDGIINKERGDYTWLPEQFEFTKNFFGFARDLQDSGFQIIVITNQGGVDKGLYSREDVEILHKWMEAKLRKEGIEIRDIYYCPHHNSVQRCLCRKPDSLLLEKAIYVHSADQSSSFMIGDKQRDVDAAEKAGVRGILIPSNPDWNSQELKGVFDV